MISLKSATSMSNQHKKSKYNFANTGWLLIEKVLQLFLGLGVAIYVARYLGPEDYGVLSYSQSLVMMFSAIAALGIDNVIVRELTQDRDNVHRIIPSAIIMKLSGGALSACLSTVTAWIIAPSPDMAVLVAIISVSMMFNSSIVVNLFFQSIEKIKFSAIANSFAFTFSALTKVTFILINAPLSWFAFALLLDSIYIAIALLIVFLRFKPQMAVKYTFDYSFAKRVFLESWPLIFSMLAVMVYSRIDQLMLMQMIGKEAVGHYSVAVKLYDAAIVLPTAIIVSFFPRVVNAMKETDIATAFNRYFQIPIILAISIAIFVTLTSFWFIPLLFGEQYQASSSVLNILIWGAIFTVLGMIRSRWVTMKKLQKYTIVYVVIGMSINILLNLILIPKYGITGAAWASFAAQVCSGYIGVLLMRKTRPFFRIASNLLNPFRWNFHRGIHG
ncbi:flippase [Shewanella sp. 10N.286.51.B7]|uniref:oligosaccharide flippase family protein n=1 Tax=Shewanella sp. 10N.286.51.B7 TaxID=1880836 RepID=UPI000C841FFC